MTIQNYPEELNYVNAKLSALYLEEPEKPASFLNCFLYACLRADAENYLLLRPALQVLMVKYPADEERLGMEREDAPEAKDADGESADGFGEESQSDCR